MIEGRSRGSPIWSAASLPARGGIRRAARWDGVAPIHAGQEFRPVTPDEVAAIVDEIQARRQHRTPFDVVVWAIDPRYRRGKERLNRVRGKWARGVDPARRPA